MFIELIATIFAGIACAGVMLLLTRTVGRRLPKWLVPVGTQSIKTLSDRPLFFLEVL